MAYSAIDKDPVSRSAVGYSDFPVRQGIHSSMTVGEMLPGFKDILQPGDKVKLSYNLTARLNYLERPAFDKIEVCQDYFFVPIQQFYKPFEQIFYGISDFGTDFYGDQNQYMNTFPHTDILDIGQLLFLDSNLIYFGSHISPELNYYVDEDDTPKIKRHAAARLADAIGFPIIPAIAAEKLAASNPSEVFGAEYTLSLWFCLAYQKIWYDHFRDTDRITNDPNCYNFDSYYTGGRSVDHGDNIRLSELAKVLQCHFCPWEDDYFTHNFVSPILNFNNTDYMASVMPGSDLNKVNTWLGVNLFGQNYSSDIKDEPLYEYNGSAVSVFPGEQGEAEDALAKQRFNTANIRAMFAVEKLLETTRRAAKHYDKQTLAHFGVDVPTGTSGECYWIKHTVQPVVIGDIVATASTGTPETEGTSQLGELGGRGYTNTEAFNINSHGEFEAKTHGVLMSIVYFRPKVTYQQRGIDRLNKLINREDFPIPEFQNLGMQPLFGFESNVYIGRDASAANAENNQIRGWKYRYSEFKEKYDVVRGAYLGTYSDWSAARVFQGNVYNPAEFYVQPNYLNPILSVLYGVGTHPNYDYSNILTAEGVYSKIFEQDPFVIDCEYNYLKLSKMSKFGLPQL